MAVSIFKLTNRNGITARITNYGGIVVALLAPDRNDGENSLRGPAEAPTAAVGAIFDSWICESRRGQRVPASARSVSYDWVDSPKC
ncbi:MAG: hypothetical protein C5B51_08710 [Terriglobia bacterium]|nr:MAG: hypothetical protein C5B51_08710 [Terriglobia bacterium]